jgi:hypothetical protein
MPELGLIKVKHVQIGQLLAMDENNYLHGRNSVVQKTAGRKCSTRPLRYEQTTIEFRSQTKALALNFTVEYNRFDAEEVAF